MASRQRGRELLDDLSWRGLVHDISDREGLATALAEGPITLYAGYDPTASSLHVGNLQNVVLQRRFQLAGHRVIALSGGGTGLIGDPSGKTGERTLIDEASIARWTAALRTQLKALLPAGGAAVPPPIFEDNLDWIGPLSAVELLRDVGKHFPLRTMLAKDSVASRLDDRSRRISYTEFSYMVLQAFDFRVLYDRHGCCLQVGGSDQWGNITVGIELVRRTRGQAVFGLTAPLILRSDGTKFGKTEEGALWLDRERTSPFALYQYFLGLPDADVGALLRRLSLRPRAKIEELERTVAEHSRGREAQRALAEELTEYVHGPAGLAEARETSEWLFGGGELRAGRDLESVVAGAPAVDVAADDWPGWERILVDAALTDSLSGARRLIAGGGAYVNDRRIAAEEPGFDSSDFEPGGIAVLRKGKRHRALVRISKGL
jgi:tyrosyl-tRNA synthetase